jgi:cytochrome c-type biogenesis protein CcmE
MRRKKNKKVAGALSVLIIGAAAGVIVKSSFSAGQYYRTVAETAGDADKLVGESFRIAGKVLPGSIIVANTTAPDYTFKVNDAEGNTVTVHYANAVPDTFKEKSEVVVEGKLVSPDLFEAHHLVAKCPSKYEGSLTKEEVARREAEAAAGGKANMPATPVASPYGMPPQGGGAPAAPLAPGSAVPAPSGYSGE